MLNTYKSKYKCVVWDWNGTIIDDVHTALKAVNDMLLKRNMSPITLAQYHSYIDTPIYKFYENIFDLSVVTMDMITKEFDSGYEKYLKENPINDGAFEIMQMIKDNACKQIIVSSSNDDLVNDKSRRFGVAQYMDFVSGSGNSFVGSKVERAKSVIGNVTNDYKSVIVIGDTLHDFELSQELGSECVLISTGHQSRSDLLRTGKPVIDSLYQLKEYLF